MRRTKRSRFEPGGAPGLRLTERDVEIVKAVARYRVLHSEMIGRAVALAGFETGGIDTCREAFDPAKKIRDRLTELFHGGFLDRPRSGFSFALPGSDPIAYAVGREGERLLARLDVEMDASPGRKTRNATSGFLEHQLLINEVAISLRESVSSNMSVAIGDEMRAAAAARRSHPFRFSAEVTLGTETRTIGTEPDLAFTIGADDRTLAFFVEVDRSTEPALRYRYARGARRPTLTGTSILRKLLAYGALKRTDTIKDRLGWRNFKVLFVCETLPGSGNRIARLMEVVRDHVPKQTAMFLFASADDITQSDNILQVPWRDADGNITRLDPERIRSA